MSKELEELEELNYNLSLTKTTTYINHYYDIKNALLKAQEMEKVLEIFFEKFVDVELLNVVDTAKDYNRLYNSVNRDYGDNLTEEEFDLLKEKE